MELLDAWRVIILAINAVVLCGMLYQFVKEHKLWNSKYLSYSYARMMWTVAGVVFAVEGIIRDSHFSVILIFISLASIAGLIGLLKSGVPDAREHA